MRVVSILRCRRNLGRLQKATDTSVDTVLVAPDYRASNPYQSLLASELEACGTQVQFLKRHSRYAPLTAAAVRFVTGRSVVHLHWIPFVGGTSVVWASVRAIRAALDVALLHLSGFKIVWTVHNIVSHETAYPKIELCVRRVRARIANRIIVHHEEAKALVSKEYWVKRSKIEVIPHGHYRNCYGGPVKKEDARTSLGLPVDGPVLLAFGHMRPYKGIPSLLSAWRGCAELSESAVLLIAGRPLNEEYEKYLLDIAGEAKNVQFHLRYIVDADVATYFSAADYVVFPFEQITTSGGVLLAASYGLPIIAPRVAAVTSVVRGEDAYLYSPEDIGGLDRAIERAVQTPVEIRRQKVVYGLVDWSEVARRHLAVYKAAAGVFRSDEFS